MDKSAPPQCVLVVMRERVTRKDHIFGTDLSQCWRTVEWTLLRLQFLALLKEITMRRHLVRQSNKDPCFAPARLRGPLWYLEQSFKGQALLCEVTPFFWRRAAKGNMTFNLISYLGAKNMRPK